MLQWFKKKNPPVLSPQAGYDLWALSYAQESNPIKDLSNKFVESAIPDLRGKSVLDAGCGTGHFCVHATDHHASQVIGVDFSQVMIERASRNCPAARFYCGDLSTLTLSERPVDVII